MPDHKEPLFAIASDPEAMQTTVSLYYKNDIEEHSTIEDYRRLLIGNLYNNMINERFSELTKQADPTFLFAYSGTSRIVRTKAFYVMAAMVKEGGLNRGLETLLTEAERIKQHGFTEGPDERFS